MKILNIANTNKKISLFCRDSEGKQVIVTDDTFYPYFFEIDQEGKFKSFDGLNLRKVFVSHPAEVPKMRSITSYSSDISFTKRYIIDRIDKIDVCPIKLMFLDIEVVSPEFPEPSEAKHPISCITVWDSFSKKYTTWYLGEHTEEEILSNCINHIYREKPDLLLAWNIDFDYTYIYNRLKRFKRDFAREISPIKDIRRGNEQDIFYPAGISILDYLGLFKKVFMREQSYALDNVAQKHLEEKAWVKSDFSKISSDMKAKNINDVLRMVKIEEKYKLINYFNEIRILTKSIWEDLTHNSFIIEMLLLEEAKLKNIVLPNKPPKSNIPTTFEGAIRDYSKTGCLYDIGVFDLTSAYPSMIIDFCLDSQNIIPRQEVCSCGSGNISSGPKCIKCNKLAREDSLAYVNGKYVGQTTVNNIIFRQNQNALLPSIVKKILVIKNKLKKELNSYNPDTQEHKELSTKYEAIKGVINSCFGVIGYNGFRLFDNTVVASITYLVRDLLNYVRMEIEKEGYNVLYWDTDSLMVDTKEDITNRLNDIVKDWAKNKYNKNDISIEFDYKGYFERLFLLKKCRYYGYLRTSKGLKEEIKGIEVKRSSSSKYEASFQRELLNRLLNGETKEKVEAWLMTEKEKIKTLPIEDIAFPFKVRAEAYEKNKPIFIRAIENTTKMVKNFKVERGELCWYIFMNPPTEVLAFSSTNKDFIDKKRVDYSRIIDRNIDSKAQNIFDAMDWIYNTNMNQLLLF